MDTVLFELGYLRRRRRRVVWHYFASLVIGLLAFFTARFVHQLGGAILLPSAVAVVFNAVAIGDVIAWWCMTVAISEHCDTIASFEKNEHTDASR